MAIEQTKQGWSVQLRIGAGRRLNFRILTQSEGVALARSVVMTELSRLLVTSGRLTEAHESLATLGDSGSDEEFADNAAAIRALCAEPLPAAVTPAGGKTFRQLGEDWSSGRLAAAHKGHVQVKDSAQDDVAKLAVLCELGSADPDVLLGDVLITRLSLDDADAAMSALPDTVESNSTRRHYAQVIRRVMKLAVYPCKLIKASPIPPGFCPKPGKQPDFTCLYPREDARLMGCAEVDVWERAFYGFAVRWGLRLSSMLALTWRHVDLEMGILRTLAKDTRGGKKVVEFALEPDEWRTLSLLRELCKDKPDAATVFPPFDRTSICKRLRAALLLAGLDRRELFVSTDTCEALRFHDLRASFVTFALLNGKPEAWIKKRTGHRSSEMIEKYRRDHYARLPMTQWLALDVALGLAPVESAPAPERRAEANQEGQHRPAPERLVAHLAAPAEGVAALGQIDDVAVAGRGLPLALPDRQGAAQGPDQAPALALPGQAEQLEQGLVAQAVAGAAHFAPWSLPEGVAAGVAAVFGSFASVSFESSMFCASFACGSTRVRTGDLRIKSPASCEPDSALIDGGSSGDRTHALRIKNPESRSEEALAASSEHTANCLPRSGSGAALSCSTKLVHAARDVASLLEAPAPLPARHGLEVADLEELIELARAAKRWSLVAKLAAELEAHAAQTALAWPAAQEGHG